MDEIANSFPFLSNFCIMLSIRDEPGYASIFLTFLAALALNQEMLDDIIHFDVVLWSGDIQGVAQEVSTELHDSALEAAGDLRRAWAQLSKMLPGKAREVEFDCDVVRISTYT